MSDPVRAANQVSRSELQYALVMRAGGHMIRIAKIPNFTPLQGTILGWQVENIQAVAAWLREHGVATEKYPLTWDLDRAYRRQGSLVQGSRRKRFLSISQHAS